MGTSSSGPASNVLLEDYHPIQAQPNNPSLSIYEHSVSHQRIAIKEDTYNNQKHYQSAFKALAQRNEMASEHVLTMGKLWSKEHSGICSNVFKIYRVYEWPRVKLIDEIEARKERRLYFEEGELMSVLLSCLNARLSTPLLTNVSPHTVFILPEGSLKVIHPDLQNSQVRTQYSSSHYYSPQKMLDFNDPYLEEEGKMEEQAVFVLGMTILHSALLEDLNDCYDLEGKGVFRARLQMRIEALLEMEYPTLGQLLPRMLAFSPSNRLPLQELSDAMAQYFDQCQVTQSQHTLLSLKPISNLVPQTSSIPLAQNSLIYSGDTNQVPKSNNNTELKRLLYPEDHQPPTHKVLTQSKIRNYQLQVDKENSINDKMLAVGSVKITPSVEASASLNQYLAHSKDLLCSETLPAPTPIIPAPTQCVFVMKQEENGKRYEGMMINGRKHGYGKLSFADGACYEGNFDHDAMHGHGTLYYQPNQPAYVGYWLQNQFHGYGTLFNQAPTSLHGGYKFVDFNRIGDWWFKFEGQFREDAKQGLGKIYLTNGQVMEGIFSKGLLNGQCTFHGLNGHKTKGLWRNNIMVVAQ